MTNGVASDRLREQRGRDYDAYLQRIGHAEKVAAVDAEAAAGVQAREIVKVGSRTLSPYNAVPKLAALWVLALVLLSSALWMLVLGGGARLLAHHHLI